MQGFTVQTEDNKMLSDKIGLIYTQNCNQQDEIRKKVDEIEMDLKNKLKSFEYVWKVENFAQLQCYTKSAGTEEIVYSDPFYTSEFGYKIRLRLYPNGNGAGKGTHLYVFLQVMKGPHDAILNWPIARTRESRVGSSVPDSRIRVLGLTRYTAVKNDQRSSADLSGSRMARIMGWSS
uniref:MATH domain-containing protein n=1 Tax=Strigamia maritima TaxID=126957 RepID=T1IS10_STRMM